MDALEIVGNAVKSFGSDLDASSRDGPSAASSQVRTQGGFARSLAPRRTASTLTECHYLPVCPISMRWICS